ncbi:hypothetical protein KP509_19G005000 [Ceratopteris richardii]|uniref:Secreted protein n=1 Tax=Ceratopteris richardii TaxID=49495 RepID=A0A8T2SLK5_CERRI|nr:hypothetical protein KP509_19G005000 [Ceratopteris richardii]
MESFEGLVPLLISALLSGHGVGSGAGEEGSRNAELELLVKQDCRGISGGRGDGIAFKGRKRKAKKLLPWLACEDTTHYVALRSPPPSRASS